MSRPVLRHARSPTLTAASTSLNVEFNAAVALGVGTPTLSEPISEMSLLESRFEGLSNVLLTYEMPSGPSTLGEMFAREADRSLLLRHLASQRHHVLTQLDDLTDAQLRSVVLPSGWTPLGLVRHLTMSDERYWFDVVMGGAPLDYWPEGANADWLVSPDEAASDVIDAYRAAITRSDEVIAGLGLDQPPIRLEPWWSDAGLAFPDLRTVMMHVIVETATHAGHLDAARELIDGHQHLVL